MCDSPMPSVSAKKREAEYRAEDDHRTLTRAEEVKADKARMAGVMRHHRKQSAALKRTGRALGAGRTRRA